jgi:NAD(P)-dependent dehydrogenase (short-subunit alcohol dehydrogenase family)
VARFRDRVTIVTGAGAPGGIGAAVARALVAEMSLAAWDATLARQLPHGVRHQPFAAGLVDGSAAPFDDDHVKPRPCSMQRGSQACRATTGDEQVDHVKLDSAAFSTLIRVLSRAALSTENTSAVIHPVCTNGSATPSATTAT